MTSDVDTVKLQLAMAFGQGAGAMLAEPEALQTLLTENSSLIDNAMRDWKASQWAFITLVRILGQVSATRAAVDGSHIIRWRDIEGSLKTVMLPCPCAEFDPRRRADVTR